MTEHLNDERLNGLVDGTLVPAERARVLEHVTTCAQCRGEVERLQGLVARARALPRSIEPPADLWPGIQPHLRVGRRVLPWGFAIAATILIAFSVLLVRAGRTKASLGGWVIAGVEGTTTPAAGVFRPGQELRTDSTSRVHLRVGDLGTVSLDPDTRVRLLASSRDEQRLALDHGTIEAQIIAPARVFLVETPAALAVDLGCAYVLTTDSTGNGLLHVTSGWVELTNGGRLTVVPRDAYATIRAGRGPGTARAAGASPDLVRALDAWDFERGTSAPENAALLRGVLAAASRRLDGVTLLNLLTVAPDSLRAEVYERLAALAPPPRGVTRAGALALDTRMLNRWWDDLVPPRLEKLKPQAELAVEPVARGLDAPVHLTAPAGDDRLFVVEQEGRIRIIKGGRVLDRPFLDIARKVASGGERGLLSMAFHPRYRENGFFYVNYTDREGDTQIERYRVSADPDVADSASVRPLLRIEQPYSNHNGGHVLFGPDGMLYIGTGDGGAGGDPHGHGQNRSSLLGKLLRMDVDAAEPRPEIWALGLRNPWRMAFDQPTGLLYIADVGQNRWEEINVQPADRRDLNYGWNRMEGAHCYGLPVCRRAGLVEPLVEYSHDDGCSITGGVVYRGKRLPFLAGHYLYSDYCSGFLRSFRYVNGAVVERRQWPVGDLGSVYSFGEDAAGEVYIVSGNGTVYRLVGKQ